jgi:F-type H+-transporting ATPase subunit a
MSGLIFAIQRVFLFSFAVSSGAVNDAVSESENAKEAIPELTNFIMIIGRILENLGHKSLGEFLEEFQNPIFFTLLIIFPISGWAFATYKRSHTGAESEIRKRIPRGFSQNFWEWVVQSLTTFTVDGLGLGDRGKSYVPFIGSLFLFILLNNLLGVVPLMKSATSSLNITLSLAVIVFLTVQIHGVRALGFLGWVKHLAGIEPGNNITYFLVPLMLPLHVLGEMIKPISLSLRLFGNIFGEDILLAVFVGLGAIYFLPLQTPFYFLALLTSFIQTMVFTLLACSYIASFSHIHVPHETETATGKA